MLMNGNDGDGLDDGPTVIGEYGGGEYGGGRIGMLMDGAPIDSGSPIANVPGEAGFLLGRWDGCGMAMNGPNESNRTL